MIKETDVYQKDGKKNGKLKVPKQFNETYRPDLIKRAVIAEQSLSYHPYAPKKGAGLRHSTDWTRNRQRHFKCAYGWGISRVPKKVLSRPGGGWQGVISFHTYKGAMAPQCVGGRKAHPPKLEKIIIKKINKNEKKKALRSAVSATAILDLIKLRGHKIPDVSLPIIAEDIENIKKTKDVLDFVKKLGLKLELERSKTKKVRAGRGKTRGRKYKTRTGPLFVVSKKCPLLKSAKNIPGIETIEVNNLNVEILAPGTHAGRLVIWSKPSIELMEKNKLFM